MPPSPKSGSAGAAVGGRGAGKSNVESNEENAASVTPIVTSGNYISRVSVLSTAFAAPIEVYSVGSGRSESPSRLHRHRPPKALSVAGVGIIECMYLATPSAANLTPPPGIGNGNGVGLSDDRDGKQRGSTSRSHAAREGGESSDSGGERNLSPRQGDNGSSGGAPRSGDDWEDRNDASDFDSAEMSPETQSILERTRKHTRRLRRSAKRWRATFFEPCLSSLTKALGPAAAAGAATDDSGARPPQRDNHGLLRGVGHPAGRHLEFWARGAGVMPRVAALAQREYLRQCEFTNGVAALGAALNLVRRADQEASRLSGSSDWGASPGSSGGLGAMAKRAALGQHHRSEWLEQVRPVVVAAVEGCSASRAESPDIQSLWASAWAGAETMGILASGSSASLPGPLREAEELEEAALGGFSTDAAGTAGATNLLSCNESWEESVATTTGERRLQFWDGFFAYRELGTVSREVAATHGTDERSGNTRAIQPGSSRMAKEQPPSFAAARQRTVLRPGLCSDGDADGSAVSVFSSLGRHRRAGKRALRRPPGNTASARRSPREEKEDEATKLHLPSLLVEEAVAGDGVGISPAQPAPFLRNARRLQERSTSPPRQPRPVDLPLPSSQRLEEPLLTMPMFMGGATTAPSTQRTSTRGSTPPPLPCVTGGVGFELPHLARPGHPVRGDGGARDGDSALRKDSPRKSPPERGTLQIEKQKVENVCAYCAHHGIEPVADPPLEKWSQRAGVRHIREKASKTDCALALCLACGGRLDTPFLPRGLPALLSSAAASLDGSGIAACDLDLGPCNDGSAALAAEAPGGIGGAGGEGPVDADTAEETAAAGEEAAAIDSEKTHHWEIVGATSHLPVDASVAFGGPKLALSMAAGVYFLACERLSARPLAHAAAALAESGGLASESSAVHFQSKEPPAAIMISMRNAELDDRGLAALVQSVAQRDGDLAARGLHVDLSGNFITDQGVRAWLKQLEHPLEWARALRSLDLTRNRKLTANALEPLQELLVEDKLQQMRCLRLGGMEMADAFAQRLFGCICDATSSYLEELALSFLGIGRTGARAPFALAALLRQCSSLRILDLSGNHLQADALGAVGSAISEAAGIRSVHIAHNTGNWPGGATLNQNEYSRARCALPGVGSGKNGDGNKVPFPPSQGSAMCSLCEHLPRMPALRLLDLRDSQVDPRSAFVLASGLAQLTGVETVLLSGNPIGLCGVRALLSIAFLSEVPAGATEDRLSLLLLDPCLEESMHAWHVPLFTSADPSGSYVFDLRDPWSRAVASYCIRRWVTVRARWSFEKAFQNLDLDGKVVKELGHGSEEAWEVPQSGILSFTFLMPARTELNTGEMRPQDLHRRSLTPDLTQKALRIAACCKGSPAFMNVVRALAADFRIPTHLMKTLCGWLGELGAESRALQRVAAEAFLDSAEVDDGGLESIGLLELVAPLQQPPSRNGVMRTADARSTLDFLVAGNPTGRYVLNLAAPSERLCAEQLLLLAAWEAELAKAESLGDVSQVGNYQLLRNEALSSKGFTYRPDWVLPSSGILEFDLAVPRRPARTAKALANDPWERLLAVLSDESVPSMVLVLCLRRVSTMFYVSCLQVRTLLEAFARSDDTNAKNGSHAVNVVQQALFSVLLFRTTDYRNMRALLFKDPKGPFSLKEKAVGCENALGRLNLADPLQIHGQTLLLRLETHEDRQILKMLLMIAYVEGGKALEPSKFPGCAYGPSQRELEPMSMPPEWWARVAPPLRGVVSITYAGDDGNVKLRKKLARQFCRWDI